MTAHMMEAGMVAAGESAKKAMPLGSDKTPAPTIDLARLNVELATVASPPFLALTAAAVMLTCLALEALGARRPWPAPFEANAAVWCRANTDANKMKNRMVLFRTGVVWLVVAPHLLGLILVVRGGAPHQKGYLHFF